MFVLVMSPLEDALILAAFSAVSAFALIFAYKNHAEKLRAG